MAEEAPWHMGRYSRNLRVLLNIVLDLVPESEYIIDEAIIRARMAKNERAMIRGFTPVHCMVGL